MSREQWAAPKAQHARHCSTPTPIPIAHPPPRHQQLQQLEADLAKAAARVAEAERQTALREAELAAARQESGLLIAIKDAEQTQLSLSAQQLGKQLEREMARAAALEDRLAAADAARGALEARGDELVARLESAAGAARREAVALQQRADALERDLLAARGDADAKAQQAARALAAERVQREAAARRCDLLESQLQEVTEQADGLTARVNEVQQALAAAEGRAAVAETLAAGAGAGDVAAQLSALRSQVTQQEKELAAAGQAVKIAAAAGALQRQLERARAEAAAAQQLAARLPDAEAEAGRYRAELDQWRALFKKATGVEHPSAQAVTAMQGDLLRAKQQLADARSELAEAQARAASTAAARAAAAAEAARQQGAAELTARKLRLAEGRLAILQTEADGLKHMVRILEGDAGAAAGADGGGDAAATGEGEAAQVAAARAVALTAELAAAREQLTAAEELATAATEGEAAQRVRAEEAEAAAKALEREAEDAGRELARLQACVAAGDFNPATTRVLHLAANPATERRRIDNEATIARLQAECVALRHQLQSAAGGGGAGGAGGGGAASAEAGMALAQKEAELAMAQRQVSQLSRQEARLRELFGESTKAFREAVRCLFGYRVDMQAAAPGSAKGALVLLRPDGAAAKAAGPPGDRDPQLQFRFTPASGRLELLPTPLSKALAKEVSTFVERFASVPAFTANLTMDLFQKASAAGGG